MDREVKLKKIPLKEFIDTLISIYEQGAEYIDIIGVPNEEQDSIGIAVTGDYMMDGLSEEDLLPKPDIRKHLTDDDLSSLT